MEKSAFIMAHAPEFEVQRMCRLLGLSRSYYYSLTKADEKEPRDSELEKAVVKWFTHHKERYGTRRLMDELADNEGMKVGRDKIATMMKQNGLKALQPRSSVPKTTQPVGGQPRCPNLLLEHGPVEEPDRIWVGDITYLPMVDSQWCYLAKWMDLFSRMIVGWEVEDHMREELIIRPFIKAEKRRCPPPGMIVHSDGGGQYGSKRFRRLLAGKYRQSMTRQDNVYDNAHAASFFARFKMELMQGRAAFRSVEDAKKTAFAYIEEYYNIERRHSSLGNISPYAYEERFGRSRE